MGVTRRLGARGVGDRSYAGPPALLLAGRSVRLGQPIDTGARAGMIRQHNTTTRNVRRQELQRPDGERDHDPRHDRHDHRHNAHNAPANGRRRFRSQTRSRSVRPDPRGKELQLRSTALVLSVHGVLLGVQWRVFEAMYRGSPKKATRRLPGRWRCTHGQPRPFYVGKRHGESRRRGTTAATLWLRSRNRRALRA